MTVLLLNGIILGRGFNVPVSYLSEIIYYHVFHGVFELTALLMFAAIGFNNLIEIIQTHSKYREFYEFRKFLFATALLLFASVIEYTLMCHE